MMTVKTIDISDLPAFFKNLDERIKIHPVLYYEKGDREGFRLVLEGEGEPLIVTEYARPLRVVDVRDALPILREGHVWDRLADDLQVRLHGCF